MTSWLLGRLLVFLAVFGSFAFWLHGFSGFVNCWHLGYLAICFLAGVLGHCSPGCWLPGIVASRKLASWLDLHASMKGIGIDKEVNVDQDKSVWIKKNVNLEKKS